MARNASGIYSLPLPDVAPDEIISASWANTSLNDIEQAITDSLPRDGSAPMVGPFKLADGTASLPSFAFNSEASTGLFRPSSGILAITVSGTERARFKGGNLLIGTTTDTGEKLQVAGTVKVSTLNADSGNIPNLSSDLLNTTLILGTDGLFANNVSGAKFVAGNGTVSAPSITFGDTTTGLYSTTGNMFVSASGVRRLNISTTDVQVLGSANFSVGRTRSVDGDTYADLVSTSTSTDYDLRIKRASGTNGIASLSQKGTGRFEFSHDTGSEFRFSTNATSAIHKTVVAGITAGADFGVFGSNISTTGEIRHFLQNSAQTATNYHYSITRNATGGIAGHLFRVGGDVNSNSSVSTALTLTETAIIPNLQVQNIVGTEAAPAYTFLNDTDTGIYRYAANAIGFATNGTLKLRIVSDGSMYQTATAGNPFNVSTTTTTLAANFDANTGTADQNNISLYINSAGGASLILRNDAKTAFTTPFQISRNATQGAAATIFRLGGTTSTSSSDFEAARFTYTAGSNQGKLIIGNTNADVFYSNGDTSATDNFQVYSVKTSANGPVAMLGSDGTNGILGFSRTNSASKRIVISTVESVSVSNTAGAERGKLDLKTKAAADSAPTTRVSVDENVLTSTVPINAPKSVNASLTLNNYYSATAGFTLNTSLTVGEYFVYNNSAAAITITQGAGLTIRQSGTANTGNRTLAQRGIARIFVLSSTEYIIQGDIT